jgi:hypothetical protein
MIDTNSILSTFGLFAISRPESTSKDNFMSRDRTKGIPSSRIPNFVTSEYCGGNRWNGDIFVVVEIRAVE